jgi:hypothetical protein
VVVIPLESQTTDWSRALDSLKALFAKLFSNVVGAIVPSV